MANRDSVITKSQDKLQGLAEKILKARKGRKRSKPIIIEFAGSPKSGKTSCLHAMDLFFRRNGYTTKIITEKAHISPIANKKDPLYNLWTFSSTLADLSAILGCASKNSDVDIVFVDRGIFDAFCWFRWLHENQHLGTEDVKAIESFVLMDRLVRIIDLVFVFSANPLKSLEWEHTILLTEKPGTIMNQRVLDSYNAVVSKCYDDKKSLFKKVFRIDVSQKSLKQLNFDLTLEALTELTDSIEEKVCYVKKNGVEKQNASIFLFYKTGIVSSSLGFDSRDKVESDSNLIQLVPIVVITNQKRDKVLVVEKGKNSAETNSPEYKKLLPYLGGHVRNEDFSILLENNLFGLMNRALQRELKEELSVDHVPTLHSKSWAIWLDGANDNPKSRQHMAICDVWEVDFDEFTYTLDMSEFAKKGLVKSVDDLYKNSSMLEPWGRLILEKIFNKNFINQKPAQLFPEDEL